MQPATVRPSKTISLSVVVMSLAVLLVFSTAHITEAQQSSEEYQVKAAFIFHFAQLVDWPTDALDSGTQILNLCLFADNPHRQEIQNTVQGKRIGTRTFLVRTISEPQEIQGCNILFMSRDGIKQQSHILEGLRGQPILTIGETQGFISAGGMIRFRLQDDRIRFDVNLAAASAAGLRISSRLLLLATHVVGNQAENHQGF